MQAWSKSVFCFASNGLQTEHVSELLKAEKNYKKIKFNINFYMGFTKAMKAKTHYIISNRDV